MAAKVSPVGDYAADSGNQPPGEDNEQSLKNHGSRRRTKTGCLTCRRRRIKCGEERPICRNCVKSKRHCEGYNPRVVWRPQVIDFQHLQNGAASITFPAATLGAHPELGSSSFVYDMESSHVPHMGQVPYPDPSSMQHPLSPHGPMAYPEHVGVPGPPMPYQQAWPQMQYLQSDPGHAGYGEPIASQRADSFIQIPPHTAMQFAPPPGSMPIHSSELTLQYAQSPWIAPQPYPPQVPFLDDAPLEASQGPVTSIKKDWPPTIVAEASTNSAQMLTYVGSPDQDPRRSESSEMSHVAHPYPAGGDHIDWSAHLPPAQIVPLTNLAQITTPNALQQSSSGSEHFHSPRIAPNLLNEAAVEYQDDDYYDVFPSEDDESPTTQSYMAPVEEEAVLEQIYKVSQMQIEEGEFRDGVRVLGLYNPETVANPLRNSATARVYLHFVHVTGPLLSSQGRRSPLHLNKSKVPFTKRGLWTHTIPSIALNDQGLLQAVLALSSFQIAALTGDSTTPSYKHYAFALKRVHQAVGKPKHRHSIPVLAASLLLSTYELWSADHKKWNTHLAGAGQLLVEIDFVEQQRRIMNMKAEQAEAFSKGHAFLRRHGTTEASAQEVQKRSQHYEELEQLEILDTNVLSKVAGRVVNYLRPGRVLDEGETDSSSNFSLSVSGFEIQKDLFWAFCRQDAIGCLVSGNPLLMPFDRWTDCPPRGPISAINGNTLGLHDHLFLLLGRVGDFNIRDRRRKLSVRNPGDGTELARSGSTPRQLDKSLVPEIAGATHLPKSKTERSTPPSFMPHFFGMTPTGPNAPMPSSYNIGNKAFPPDSPEALGDLHVATEQALRAWQDLMDAVGVIESHLSPAYQPIVFGEGQTSQTPFGPSLHYASLDIACAWVLLYSIRIIINRVHPNLPPHHHVAVGLSVEQNRTFVEIIGRICGGMVATAHHTGLDIDTAAALVDVCIPLFVAGLQVMQPQQREWLVSTLGSLEVGRGYRTAGTISRGLERAWMAMARTGRGPPYEPRGG